MADDVAPADDQRTLGRVNALSDGVFAIALTVLVLNLDVPVTTAGENVGQALVDEVPQLAAQVLSFVVIGLFWLAHSRLYDRVVRVDGTLMAINLANLGLIALIPFPTSVLGEWGDQAPAAAAYAAVLGLAGLMGAAAWLHVLRAGLAAPHVPRDYLVHGAWRGAAMAAVFLVSVPLTFVSVSLAEWSWTLVAVTHAVLGRIFAAGRRAPAAAER